MAFCSSCGTKNPAEALYCEECGAKMQVPLASIIATAELPLPIHSIPRVAPVERTESIVIQVAPDYENGKIGEMEQFGWYLQGRQEIHQEGDAYGAPNWNEKKYVVKIKVSHYVKLHFARSLNLPYLAQIKQIEAEYFALPFPALPRAKSYLWPLLLIVGALLTFTDKTGGAIPGGIMIGIVGVAWLAYKLAKRSKNLSICERSLQRREELLRSVEPLMSGAITQTHLAVSAR